MNGENFRPESSSSDELSGPLRQAVIELRGVVPPSETLARVIDRAIELPTVRPPMPPSRRWLRYSLAAAAAAAVLIAFGMRLFAPSDTWAQVVKEVQMKPWIHCVVQLLDGKMEEWISFPREVGAVRSSGNWALFDDGKAKVRYEFQPGANEDKQGTLTRAPLPSIVTTEMRKSEDLFLRVLGGERRLDAPVPNMETISNDRRTVLENDKTWIEYEFVLRSISRDETIRSVLRVDPKTNLPASMKLSSLSGGPTKTQETAIDYPDENAGPRDIYDLGVPRTATLVDRMPSTKLADVVSAIRAGQRKFGSYFAVVAHTLGRDSKPWEALELELVWRNGKKFRVESVLLLPQKPPERPAVETDMMAWWKERVKSAPIIPQRVCDGKIVWIGEVVDKILQPNQHAVKTTWKQFGGVNDGDDFNTWVGCVSIGTMPDVMAYGFPPAPSGTREVKLLENPPDGPAGCILAEVRSTHRSPGTYHRTRNWYDPSCSYVMRKFEIGDLQPINGEPPNTDTYEVETLAKTPPGIWYPTCIRRTVKFEGKAAPAPQDESCFWYFVDFDAKLPDSLFKPEARTGEFP
jgi:hypothetical protein